MVNLTPGEKRRIINVLESDHPDSSEFWKAMQPVLKLSKKKLNAFQAVSAALTELDSYEPDYNKIIQALPPLEEFDASEYKVCMLVLKEVRKDPSIIPIGIQYLRALCDRLMP